MRLSKARSGSALQKAATSAIASAATTAHGCSASAWKAVIFSPNSAPRRSWMSQGACPYRSALARRHYLAASGAIDAPARLPSVSPFRRSTRSSWIFSCSFITP